MDIPAEVRRLIVEYLTPSRSRKGDISAQIAPYLRDEKVRNFFLSVAYDNLEKCNDWASIKDEFSLLFDPFQIDELRHFYDASIFRNRRLRTIFINKINQWGLPLPTDYDSQDKLKYCLNLFRIELFHYHYTQEKRIEYKRRFLLWKKPVEITDARRHERLKTKAEIIAELSR